MSARDRSGTSVAAVIFTMMIAGVLYRYWPNEERDIRRHLSNLAEALSIPTTDNEVERITRFAALREYFSSDVRVRIDQREVVTRDALIGLLRDAQPPPGGIKVEFADVVVTLAPDSRQAMIQLTAKVVTTEPGTTNSVVDARSANVVMTTLDGDWVIASAEAH